MFVQIHDFPMYLVDENGTVASMTKGKWKLIKPYNDPGRYSIVTLCREGKAISRTVHRLVMEAWRGKSALQVNHKNGNKQDNRLENLEYCTSSENRQHAYKTGLQDKTFEAVRKVGKSFYGEKHAGAKLSDEDATYILASKGAVPAASLAKCYGVSKTQIYYIWKGKSRKHLGGAGE